jgi:L-alanine-DL-glutamate epimerase-like enolase superfamily enzyme
VPFGGKKQSGIGRELGFDALQEYISVKAVHWNFGEKASIMFDLHGSVALTTATSWIGRCKCMLARRS